MHSVAVVESGEKRYLVALMSNVLGCELGGGAPDDWGKSKTADSGTPGALRDFRGSLVTVFRELLDKLRGKISAPSRILPMSANGDV
jgi:hypothetical protein